MSIKKQAISGVIWTFSQQFSVQIINFVVQIILARLLMPEMFGLISMISVFISIGQTLMDGGMTNSLIRTKKPDQLDYSTVFVTNFIVSIGIYIITFLAAPLIADFYDQKVLKDVLRVYAFTFVIRSLVAVHVAKLTKEMNFKTQMKLQIPSTIVGAVVGVVLANMGYGVWSLVWLNLTQTIVFTIQNWIFIKWRPTLMFNRRRFKYHFNFGYKLTLSGLLDTIYNDAYRIVIGKIYSPATVGFYNQAETMRLFPVLQISSVMGKVTYPLFSNIKGDVELKNMYKTTMKLIFFVVVPMMMILIVVAEEIFFLLLGEKWVPAVPYFQILSLASIVRPISTYNLNILKVKGRSDLFLKLEFFKKIIGIIAIIIAVPFGILTLVVTATIVAYFSTFIDMIFSGKLINYSFGEQIKDIYIVYGIGLICLVISFLFRSYLIENNTVPLGVILFTSIIYLAIYIILVYIFDKNNLEIVKKIVLLIRKIAI